MPWGRKDSRLRRYGSSVNDKRTTPRFSVYGISVPKHFDELDLFGLRAADAGDQLVLKTNRSRANVFCEPFLRPLLPFSFIFRDGAQNVAFIGKPLEHL